MNSLSEQLGGLLRSKGLLMGTAESCTGGRIANMVTLVAGSSDYFVGGVVSYSNEVKHNVARSFGRQFASSWCREP